VRLAAQSALASCRTAAEFYQHLSFVLALEEGQESLRHGVQSFEHSRAPFNFSGSQQSSDVSFRLTVPVQVIG
ncbi:hypothetical protein ACCT02_37880, partial [Rhizobium ruizarguesonis]